jgi:hypothetical protein
MSDSGGSSGDGGFRSWWSGLSDGVKSGIVGGVFALVATLVGGLLAVIASGDSSHDERPPPVTTAVSDSPVASVSPPASAGNSAEATDRGLSIGPTVTQQPSKVWLADLDVITSGGTVRTGKQNLNGTAYTHSVYTFTCGRPNVEYEYVLGRKYRRLTGLLGLNDESPDTLVRMQLEVSVDGEVLFQRIVGYGEFVSIDIDVSNRLRLSLRTTLIEDNGKVGCASGGTFVLGNPTLTSGA